MTRVSLREAYDNKDVVAQIYAIRDTAESAEDTAEQAVTTANTASEHVDALVPQVEGAVQNANSASASAQASAQTVAGYENRLATVEGDVVQLNTDVDGVESDLNAVTLRVQTAEGQIVTIQGRVTALETADGQNVKINAINNYAVGLTGNQNNIGGVKKFLSGVNAILMNRTTDNNGDGTTGRYKVIMKFPLNVSYGPRQHILFGVTTRQRNRAFDLLSLYIAISSPQNLDMVLRANIENYTYVLSYDSNYAYVSILTTGGLGDSIQTLIIGATENMLNDIPFVTVDETYDNPPGTELRRLTP